MRFLIVPIALAVTAAACETTEAQMEADAELERTIAARQGEEVDRICFARNINGWSELSRDAILLERGVNDWYKVDLAGTCDPRFAFDAIAIRSRPAGSTCLRPGDRIDTPDSPIRGSCLIQAIYEWDRDAPVPEPEDDAG